MGAATIRFQQGIAGLLLGVAIIGIESTVIRGLEDLFGSSLLVPVVEIHVLHLCIAGVVLTAFWRLFSWETVSFRTVGLSPRLIFPGALFVCSFFLAFNTIAAGLASGAGQPDAIGYHWDVSPAESVVWFAVMFLIAGVVEEVAFRGYLQTKLIALLGDEGTVRIGLGIVIASLLFAAYHLPRILAGGTPTGMTPTLYLATLTLSGIGYGVLYEWTHNLYVPILIHTAGNAPGTWGLLFVTTAGFPQWAFVGYLTAYVGVMIVVLILYRRWAFATGRMPVWTERTAGQSGTFTLSETSQGA